MADSDFSSYLAWGLPELLDRLALVTGAIVDLLPLDAEAKGEELKLRREGWNNAQGGSVTERDRWATAAALPATMTRIETENQIIALREEKGFLLTMIGVRREQMAEMADA